MNIYCLIENTPYKPRFLSEHGLSLYIETATHKILFDTGQTNAFIYNAEILGVNLGDVDIAVISHGHYDHCGGLSRFLELNSKAPVYINSHAFGDFYNASNKYIGINTELQNNKRLLLTSDFLELSPQLTLLSCNDRERIYQTDQAGLTEKVNGKLVPDMFVHEQYLLVKENNKQILFSGCSHKGILNIVNWLKPDVLVGGFHFMKQSVTKNNNPVLDNAAKILSSCNTTYYTCHCTGGAQFDYLKNKIGSQLNYLASGQQIII